MRHLVQHYVVHHGQVDVNKAVVVVNNAHVQQQGIPELRLVIASLCNTLRHNSEYEVNVAASSLQCRSVPREVLRPTTPLFTISIIVQN